MPMTISARRAMKVPMATFAPKITAGEGAEPGEEKGAIDGEELDEVVVVPNVLLSVAGLDDGGTIDEGKPGKPGVSGAAVGCNGSAPRLQVTVLVFLVKQTERLLEGPQKTVILE